MDTAGMGVTWGRSWGAQTPGAGQDRGHSHGDMCLVALDDPRCSGHHPPGEGLARRDAGGDAVTASREERRSNRVPSLVGGLGCPPPPWERQRERAAGLQAQMAALVGAVETPSRSDAVTFPVRVGFSGARSRRGGELGRAARRPDADLTATRFCR